MKTSGLAAPEQNPDREALIAAVAALRAEPAACAGIDALAGKAGVDLARLGELCRHYYHLAPGELIAGARVQEAARRLIATRDALDQVGGAAGWPDLPAFAQAFERAMGMMPEPYRRLRGARDFTAATPRGYSWARALRYWGRDPRSASERVEGEELRLAVRLPGGHATLRLAHHEGRVRCRVEAASQDPELAFDAHRVLVRMLGLELDPGVFERSVAQGPHAALVAGREGLTIPQTANVWDGLVWVVAGQQVSLVVAFGMRRRLTETFGDLLPSGLYAPPDPARVAGAEPEELGRLGFSRAKSAALLGAARATGLDLEGLRGGTAPEAEAALGALHGLGPWSVNYLKMRALGLVDCVPVGDAALVRSLAGFFGLEKRPGPRETLERMAPFAPYRSLATFHFWSLLEKKP